MVVARAPTELVSTTGKASETYAANGVILVPGVLTPEEIDHIREVFTTEVESSTALKHDDHLAGDDILSRYPRFVHPHRHLDTEAGRLARKLLVDQRLLKIATELIGPTYGAQSMFYFKPPTARGQSMHQDNMSLQSHPETCLAAWIAIDDADADNGGLMVVPGSHTNEILCHDQPASADSFSAMEIRMPPGLSKTQTKLRAGDALFFHGNLVHGSLANKSDRFRRALIFHYVPQASVEVSKFYQPLISPEGEEVYMTESVGGGPCGEAWTADI